MKSGVLEYSRYAILTTPLLQQKYHERNKETYSVPLSKKCFPPSKGYSGQAFFLNGGFNLSHLKYNRFRIRWRSAKVGEIVYSFFVAANRSKVTGGFLQREILGCYASDRETTWDICLDCEETKRHHSSGDKLQAKRDPPDFGIVFHM